MSIAEIISVGTELNLGQILNTNAQFLSSSLAELGINLFYQNVVGDNEQRLCETFLRALERSDVVILSGGLGPTEDDLTRESVAKALGRELVLDDEAVTVLQNQFVGRVMPQNNLRQAHVPEGGFALPNPKGTAPGICIPVSNGKLVFLLPGPPRELQPMFNEAVVPIMREHKLTQGSFFSSTLRCSGIGESAVAELLADLIDRQTNPTIALYSRLGEIDVRLTTRASSLTEAAVIMAPVKGEIVSRLGSHIFGEDACTLASALLQQLATSNYSLSVAESCTGGLVGHMITNEPGSSLTYMGGVVAYANNVKETMLGVSLDTLLSHGAVSEQCAREMLEGALGAFRTDAAIAITGIAGPSGGTVEKPVGTVFVAVGCRGKNNVVRLNLRGDRAAIKERAAKEAIRQLLLLLRG
ncbi:MAG: competence/damage-inducible protein A [Peptococcaceae bacterium]|nr:competence/damage-inducible protein A [Peptococcaceae bacterium]